MTMTTTTTELQKLTASASTLARQLDKSADLKCLKWRERYRSCHEAEADIGNLAYGYYNFCAVCRARWSMRTVVAELELLLPAVAASN